mmetsp:Transcript_38994/g.107584  ORF Transcript_38994/g.107584 Transcript_38994/m.107584 type:complete len:107 (-) Transcript_38994:1418-1738(-)
MWGSPFSAPGGELHFRSLQFDPPLGRRRLLFCSLAPPLFFIFCGFRLSPASAIFLLAPAVSSAGAQFFPALSPSLLLSRLSFCFVLSLSLLPALLCSPFPFGVVCF